MVFLLAAFLLVAGQVAVAQTPEPPTISISPTTANVPPDTDFLFTLATGGTNPSTSCSLNGFGTIAVNLPTVTYRWPNSLPTNSNFQATITCAATNSVGAASASATVNLVPQIVSVYTDTIFCARECAVGIPATVKGAFVNLTSFHSSDNNLLHVGTGSGTNQVIVSLNFDTPHFNPGFFEIWATNPAPGGGDSSRIRLSFLGNWNTLATSTTDAFSVDRSANTIRKFDLATGAHEADFSDHGQVASISFDRSSSLIVFSSNTQVV